MADGKKILKIVGLSCGVIVLVVGGSCVGLAWWAKRKVDSKVADLRNELNKTAEGRAVAGQAATGGITGGMQAFGGALVASSLQAYRPLVLASLPASEHADASKVFDDLREKGAKLQNEDFKALGDAMQRFAEVLKRQQEQAQAAMPKDGTTDPAQAVALMKASTTVPPESAKALVADIKAVVDKH